MKTKYVFKTQQMGEMVSSYNISNMNTFAYCAEKKLIFTKNKTKNLPFIFCVNTSFYKFD